LHQNGEVPRNNLTYHSDRLSSGVKIEVSFNGRNMTLDFICPSSIVSVAAVSKVQVSYFGNMGRLSIIDGLYHSKLIRMFFDKIS